MHHKCRRRGASDQSALSQTIIREAKIINPNPNQTSYHQKKHFKYDNELYQSRILKIEIGIILADLDKGFYMDKSLAT